MSNGQIPQHQDTLALAYFMTGDVTKAIETQEKAIALLRPNASDRGEYEAALAKYRAAAPQENRTDEPHAKPREGTP